MCSRRDDFMAVFARLRTHVNPAIWSAATLYRAPYKPLLLLTVLTQFNRGLIHRNLIEPSSELEQIYKEFCKLMQQKDKAVNMASAFISLQSSGFWTLAPRNNYEHEVPMHAITSVQRLRRIFFGARLDADLFPLLQMKSHRDRFTDTLVCTYFEPSVQQEIRRKTEIITLL